MSRKRPQLEHSTEEEEPILRKTKVVRYKCAACYKLYNKKEHLVAHMKASYHSVHQPKCGVCGKHCKYYESLREHLAGGVSKSSCAEIFSKQGCDLCLNFFDTSDSVNAHKEICRLSPTAPMGPTIIPYIEYKLGVLKLNEASQVSEAVALDCEMVGGGSDGKLDLCASVCVIDEGENVLFCAYVKPIIPVTDYRYEKTGLTEEHFKEAMPLEKVQERIVKILENGESVFRLRTEGGQARLLVGHSLENDLKCLRICYPDHMLRDTATYPPFRKTNSYSHSLKYLTLKYLGYNIQSGIHDPYEDCVAAMRLYKRIRAQEHTPEDFSTPLIIPQSTRVPTPFDSMQQTELEEMSPDDLLKLSRPKYRCWCFDLRPKSEC